MRAAQSRQPTAAPVPLDLTVLAFALQSQARAEEAHVVLTEARALMAKPEHASDRRTEVLLGEIDGQLKRAERVGR